MSSLVKYDKSKVRVLVVDDEASIREMLCIALKDDGWNVDSAENGKVAFEKIQKSPYHIVISDVQMPEMTGTDLLEATKKNFPLVEFLIMTSNATLESAVKAVKLGAYDYLNKPFEDISVVPNKIGKVADKILLRQQNQELIKRLRKSTEDLKILFETTSELNAILELDALFTALLTSVPKILRDPNVPLAVFELKSEGWERLTASPRADLFPAETALAKNVNFAAAFPDRKNLRVVPLQYGEETRAIVLVDAVGDQVLDVYLHEISTSFKKVMLHQDILSMAHRDGLTRLYNHRYFQDRLRQELSQVKRQDERLSLILLDVDHFKNYNDKHGHPAGDTLLKQLAGILDDPAHHRDSDIVARYGGEEFVVVLPFTPYEGALLKAERLREVIEKFEFPHRGEQPLGCVSVSIGVVTFPDQAEGPTELIELADKALYRSKQQGRNRVTGADQIQTLKKILEPTAPISVTEPVVEKPTLGEVLKPVEDSDMLKEEFSLPTPDELMNAALKPAPEEPPAPVEVKEELPESAEPSEVEAPVEIEAKPAAVEAEVSPAPVLVPEAPPVMDEFNLRSPDELFAEKSTSVPQASEVPPPPKPSSRKEKSEVELQDLLSSIEEAYVSNESEEGGIKLAGFPAESSASTETSNTTVSEKKDHAASS